MAMVCLTDFEEYAKEHLSKATWDYYAAGADECCTRDDNLLAYKRYTEKNKPRRSRPSQVCDLTFQFMAADNQSLLNLCRVKVQLKPI